MDELPDNSVHQMITSPSYNASKKIRRKFEFKRIFRLALFSLARKPTESWFGEEEPVSSQFRT